MADGVNNSSIRVLGSVSNVFARSSAPTGGSAPENRTTKDVFVRNDGQADVQVLSQVIQELQARIAALEAKVSDLTDDETYAPVTLGQLSKPGSWAAVQAAPAGNNAPANNLPPVNNRVLTRPAAANAPANNLPANSLPANNAVSNAPANNAAPADSLGDDLAAAIPARISLDVRPAVNAAPTAAALPPVDTATAAQEIPATQAYTVKKGDNLWDIAEQQLGDATRFKEIAEANAEKYPSLATSPDLIQPGWTLNLPTGGALPAAPVAQPAKPAKPTAAKPLASDDDIPVGKPHPKPGHKPAGKPHGGKPQGKPIAEVITPDVIPAEQIQVAKPTKPKPGKPTHGTSTAPVPVDMHGVKLKPSDDFAITNQSTKVTGVGTDTDTRWDVGPDGKAIATKQNTVITDVDTRTNSRWENQTNEKLPAKTGNIQNGKAPIPVDMNGVFIDPLKDFEIDEQTTRVEAIDTQTDTHWGVGKDGKAVAEDQATQVTGAETLTRTKWKPKGSVGQPTQPTQPIVVIPAKPTPAAAQLNDADAAKWLRANMGADGRISRKEIEAMPAGPGRDALIAHFDALLFGVIDPGTAGWTDLHEGDLSRIEKALADGGSINGLAGQLTRWVHENRKPGDLNKDGSKNEADVALYAAQLRGGNPEPAAPAPTTGTTPATLPQGGSQTRKQQELTAFLQTHKGASDIVHLTKNNLAHIQAATMEQKAQLVKQALDDAFTNKGERGAALTVLQAAAEKGELLGVVNQLNEKKWVDDLFSNMGGHDAGVAMAKLFLDKDLYKNRGVVNTMNEAAIGDVVAALGFKHPMIGTNDQFKALPDDVQRFMVRKLIATEPTLTQHRQATWLNTHLNLAERIPAYRPAARR